MEGSVGAGSLRGLGRLAGQELLYNFIELQPYWDE